MTLKDYTAAVEPSIYEVFCQLHRNPELAMQEYNTCALIEKELREKTKVDSIQHIGETGLLVELKGTNSGQARCIGLRGDMAALPIQEAAGHQVRSQVDGLMHACGHDVHTSILLGAVRILENYRSQISGSVLFFFQPGEEPLVGAKTFVESPLVDLKRLDGIAACHVLPDLEVGQVGIRRGPMLAGSNGLYIIIKGRQGHSSKPNEAIDPITPAIAIIPALQELITKELHPADPARMSIGSIHSGDETVKVVPGELRMAGSIKTLSPEARTFLLKRIPEVCEGIAKSMRCEAEVKITDGPPPLIIDDAWADRAFRVCRRLLGEENVFPIERPSMCSEDFSYLKENTPGVFVRLGSSTPGAPYGPTHNPNFCADRGTLTTGMLTLTGLALDFFDIDYN